VNPLNGLIVAMNRLGSLPGPAKALIGLMTGGSIIGIAYLALSQSKMAVLILTIGLVAVFGVMVLYQYILKFLQKRKASPLSMGIAGNAAAAPQGISEPARRARLDDLRRNFEQGVEKFRAAGKNLYSVPWYVLVGEPGSGKTEAIRHCNVGFPPGLQDQLQGAGGTLNMNWWFTNQAIILDTAGRLMFEEVAPGTTNEWNEFLKLLKGNRPNCPINGILLVIPVDTLIKDTADSIEKKCTKIAQQFDQIQRTLGVRFPVFIIITKCDLLNGFREFFDDLNDPQLQHQIMGWSNPANLDERFDPTAVTNHLETVKQRLTERRQQLLLDPVNTEDAQGRRIDQVDALYALPDSITKISPRLRRYLEMVFVAGEWSPKPLFLRGIYFTSSMTEGSALDAELAEVLGVPVDSLPEGRVWRRDRAYFLRDLFIEKVFREKGLVTRADNADKQVRTRRTIVLTCGFLAVVVLFALTGLGWSKLKESIGEQRKLWEDTDNNAVPSLTPIIDVKNDNAYANPSFMLLGDKTTLADFFNKYLPTVQGEIDIPVIFKPMNFLSGGVNAERREAFRSFYEATVLFPIYSAARAKIGTLTDATWRTDQYDAKNWHAGQYDATEALAQLMKLEYANAFKKLPDGDDHPEVDLDPLFRLVLPAATDVAKVQPDEAGLQRAADWIYTEKATKGTTGEKAWPAELLHPGDPANLAAIDQGTTTAIAYWERQRTEKGDRMSNILAVRTALHEFRNAEDNLIRLKIRPVDQLAPYNAYLDAWTAGMANLTNARDKAAAAWAAAIKDPPETVTDSPETVTLKDLYTGEITSIASKAQLAYETLLNLTADPSADPSKPADTSIGLGSAHQKLTDALKALNDWKDGPAAQADLAEIDALDNAYLARTKGTDDAMRPRFEVQAQLYELADHFLVKKDAPPPVLSGPMGDVLNKLDADVANAETTTDVLTRPASTGDRLDQAGKLADFTIDLGARRQRYDLVNAVLQGMPKGNDTDKWLDYVAARAASLPTESLIRPQVPLVSFPEKTFPARFAPDAVGSVNESLIAINKLATDPGGAKVLEASSVVAAAAAAKNNFDAYLAYYTKYWKEDVFTELSRYTAKTWTDFSTEIGNLREHSVRSSLEDYGAKAQDALNKVGDSNDAAAIQQAMLLGQKKDFQDNCVSVLSAWKDLSDSYRDCRRTILAMEPGAFMNSYSVDTGTDDGFVAHYWQHFTIEAIHVIANDSRNDILTGLQELAKYERFPLASPGDPKYDLSAQDMIAARAALDKVVGSASTSATSGAKSIGLGTPTKDKDVDDELDGLRGTNLLHDKLQYLANLQKFFVAMPTDAVKPLSVSISVIKEHLKDDNAISQKYAYVAISQGGKQLREAYLQGNVPDKADVLYPAGDLTFQFLDVPGGQPVQTATFNGPWGPFRLLTSSNIRTVTIDGNKWTIEYVVTDPNNKTWSLWLLLEFKAELPGLNDWPVPPVKSQ